MDNMGFGQSQWSGWPYQGVSPAYTSYPVSSYAAYLPESMELYSAHHRLHHQHMSRTTDSKPRLSKEEVDVLEAEFQKNHKPNSSTKKALAESMRVDNARINNWFQNRRAREKKEKNIREYAAKQKMEKDTGSAEMGDSDNDRHSDLVASSAPFPEPRKLPKLQVRESSAPSDLTSPEQEIETPATSQSEGPTAHSSPAVSIKEIADTAVVTPEVCGVRVDYCSPSLEAGLKDDFGSEPSSDFLSISERAHSVQSDELSVADFGHYQFVMPDTSGEPTPSYTQQTFSIPDQYSQYQGDYDDSSLSVGSVDDSSSPMHLKSPPSIDIASRRNRRAPHLALAGSRSYSAGVPRTGIDMGRRGEVGSSMRRVASATGTVRISKPSGTPRSPYFDRNVEALYQLNRSPNFTIVTNTVAPPTPNTPLVSTTQNGLCEVTPSSLSGNEKFPSELVVMHDPTLRTPPTTPGIMENMFALDSAYDMAIPDEPLVTPGLGGFPTDFEMPGMASNVPNYIANSCASQPQTPSFAPAPPMGPAYFGYSGGNAEYNWSDSSMSARSSPSQHSRQPQFMNMTPSNFAHIER